MEEKMVYFYCNRAEENRRDPSSILNALIHQLAQTGYPLAKRTLLKLVDDVYHERLSEGQLSAPLSLAESEKLLIQLTDIYPRTTMCIDALDEVEHAKRINLLRCLNRVIRESQNLVRIFATTRMDPDILFQFNIFPRIELQADDNFDDITLFVQTKLDSAITDGALLHGDVSPKLKLEIEDVLCDRSKGMFQLAALHITFLCEMLTEDDVRNSLQDLPDTLKDAYDETYSRILTQKRSAPDIALNAFRWIQCASVPLQSATLLEVITEEV
ncbi:hypothetical protein BDD12DRAFT_782443, partial [Trichophaea hybrida]